MDGFSDDTLLNVILFIISILKVSQCIFTSSATQLAIVYIVGIRVARAHNHCVIIADEKRRPIVAQKPSLEIVGRNRSMSQ